jgi:hypothetical protein
MRSRKRKFSVDYKKDIMDEEHSLKEKGNK